VADDPLKIWETLFQRALVLIDSAANAGAVVRGWSFGGGTVLMRRHRHRFSKDIDIFVSDPQYLGYLTPRLNQEAEKLTTDYAEDASSLKLRFPEGEIDFVVAGPLTQNPTMVELLFGRKVDVETSTEIIAKKVWHRGDRITARDIFDLAAVAELERDSLHAIRPILRGRRDAVFARMKANDSALREAFRALDVLEYRRSYDECVELVRRALR
jgi:hypothetical protein